MTPATHSPESPRRTETSPLIRLIRATPRLRSSGSCARACRKLPARKSTALMIIRNRKLPKRLIRSIPNYVPNQARRVPNTFPFEFKELHTIVTAAEWLKTTTLAAMKQQKVIAPGSNHHRGKLRGDDAVRPAPHQPR